MDKKGYSTFDAIQLIEEWFGIEDCASESLKVDPTLLANYGIDTPLLGAMPLGF